MRSEDIARIRERIATMQQDIGQILAPAGTSLCCAVCGVVTALSPAAAAYYTAHGWPKCHGQTMRIVRPGVRHGA